jgi:dTDP-4-dehydrorhamnose reductase
VFSGLPTIELARVIRDHVLPRPALRGTYHVSASPINKFDLLKLVARTYGKEIEIVEDDAVLIDRSLDSTRFRTETGYAPDDWPALVARMHAFQASAAD